MNTFFKHITSSSSNIKASSLVNAIFICVIISIFCGCLVLISHYQNILNNQLNEQENTIYRNNSAFSYFINKIDFEEHYSKAELFIYNKYKKYYQ